MIKGLWRHFLLGTALCMGPTLYAQGVSQADALFNNNGTQLTSGLALTSFDDCTAPEGCDLGCTDGGCGDLCGEGCGIGGGDGAGEITFGGWVQMGYHSGVTPGAAARNDALSFNNHPHRFNLHQGWLYAEKVADGSCGLDWGFRADIMYGVDAGDTQAFGNNAGNWDLGTDFTRGGGYGWAIPQAYGELASGDWSVKLGHFYTLIGYEVVTAPDNFFYSHALTMFNSEPFTHTGALATYTASDSTTIYAGWTAGWDTGFDQNMNGSSFLGGFSTALGDDVTFTYISTAGNFGDRSAGNSGYSHSLLFDVALSDDLNYIFQSDLVRVSATGDDQVGINQYLIYSLNDQVGLGWRTEWWKNQGDSQYAMTWGVNVKPMDNVIIRPEIRYDWDMPAAGIQDATTFGIDAIVTF